MKKRVMLGLLAVFMAVSLAGCGSTAESGSSAEENVSAEAEEATDGEVRVAAATGTYIGAENDGVAEFKGIRYGTFEAYKAAGDVTTTTEDEIEALEFGDNCIQPYDEVEMASQDPCSQDCLYLNIWTKDVETEGKPVIVFIHGGSNIWGGTSDPTYDGEYFVRGLEDGEDCVFITINYRMSVIGGLDLSVLDGYTDEYADAMNLSKLDQTQALKWVHENIEAWGGDPDNVTIMGQSAGGGAVEMLMADESTHEYFNRAIINSGTQSREAISTEQFKENSEKVCEILGVETVDELISLTDEDFSNAMDEIIDTLGTAHPGLRCADGEIISETWWEDLVNGAASDIDLLIGGTNGEEDWNAVDWDNSIYEAITDNSVILEDIEDIDTARGDTYGRLYATLEDGFIDGYLEMGEDEVLQAMDLYNDIYFSYPTYLIAKTQAANNSNTYLYAWEYAPDMEEVLEYSGDSAEVSPYGRAMHCMDLCFEFGTKEGYTELTGDPDTMSDEMIAQAREMVYNFALSGDPNNGLISDWETFGEEEYTMVIGADAEWTCETGYRADIMEYMSQLIPYGTED